MVYALQMIYTGCTCFLFCFLVNHLVCNGGSITIESTSATLTPANSVSSDGYINITIDESSGSNYIDSVNDEWECDQSSTIEACLIIDVNPPGQSIDEFNLTLNMTQVTGEIDPMVVFYNPINNTYYTFAWGWDAGLIIGSSGTQGVFVAPSCGSTSFYTATNIFDRLIAYPTSARSAFGDGSLDNYQNLTKLAVNYANPIKLTMKNDVINNELHTAFISSNTGVVSCTYDVSFVDLREMKLLFFPIDPVEDITVNSVEIDLTWRGTDSPTNNPTQMPTSEPTLIPSTEPSVQPSDMPTNEPSDNPSNNPTSVPSGQPSEEPSLEPSMAPSGVPTTNPSVMPSVEPSRNPTTLPSLIPTDEPSDKPTTAAPTATPTSEPVLSPTANPSFDDSSKDSSTATDSIFGVNGTSLLFLIIIFVIFGLLCCLVGILAVFVVYYRTKHKKNKEMEKLKTEFSLRHVASFSKDSIGKSQLELAGMSANSTDNIGAGDTSNISTLLAGGATNNSVIGSGSGIGSAPGEADGRDGVNGGVNGGATNDELNDLISLQLASQPRANPNAAIDVAINRSNIGRDDVDGDDEVDGLTEGRNANETTHVVNNGNVNGANYSNNNQNNNTNSNGNGGVNLGNKHWSQWNSGELMEFLRKEMLAVNLPEQECNVFLSDLSEQRINGSMIKLLKDNENFQAKLQVKMNKHPFAIWMVFQSTINNLE